MYINLHMMIFVLRASKREKQKIGVGVCQAVCQDERRDGSSILCLIGLIAGVVEFGTIFTRSASACRIVTAVKWR